jgi:hypothetical protein
LTAGIVWGGGTLRDRRRAQRASGDSPRVDDRSASFATLVGVSVVGVLVHVLMDLPTSYGTRILSPFSWRWFAVDWMPIIDIYMLMVLVASMFGPATETADHRRRKANIVLALIAANYGLRGASHYQAMDLAPRLFGPTLPALCDPPSPTLPAIDSWPRPTPPSPPEPGHRCLVEIAAMPTFTSPFRWRIVAQMSNAFEVRDIDLLDKEFRDPDSGSDAPWRLSLRYPNVWTPAVQRAAETRLGQKFLAFSRFPAARVAVDAHGATTVRRSDIRFVGGVTGLDQPAPRTGLFRATIRIAPDGTILEETLGR